MPYKNISGTTMPTFKLRNGRLELISAILTQEDGSKIDQFKIRDSKGDSYRVADERDIKIINDYINTKIEGSKVKKISYEMVSNRKVLTIETIDAEGNIDTIALPMIFTPEETSVGEIVLYGSSDGEVLKSSKMLITNSADDISNGSGSTIPTSEAIKAYTSKAIRDYVGEVSTRLEDRLAGNNVKEPAEAVLPE